MHIILICIYYLYYLCVHLVYVDYIEMYLYEIKR